MSHNEKILITDDMPANVELLTFSLAIEGYEIVKAYSGEAALTIAKNELPDLILLDVMMPGIDGYEVCRQLKSEDRTRHIPVIFITSKKADQGEAKGLKAGAVDYLTKPFNMAIVKARVRTHLDLRKSFVQLENQASELRHEIRTRQEMQEDLEKHRHELEQIVGQRTVQLRKLNQELEHEIIVRKRAEQLVKSREKQFRSLVENSPVGICIIQKDQIIYQNAKHKKFFEGLPELSDFSQLLKYTHSDDAERVRWFYGDFSEGEPQIRETYYRFHPPDEEVNDTDIRWFHCQARLFRHHDSEAILVNMMDVTRLKELEHIVTINDRMSALGRIAAGIAHEIRNPLTGINSYLYTLDDICSADISDSDDMKMMRQIIRQIQTASNKIESVIRRVLDFSRPAALKMELISLNRSLREILTLSVAAMKKKGIRVSTTLDSDIPGCYADPHLIEQVFLNLLNNASRSLEKADCEKIIEISTFSKDDRVVILFSDSGPGVPAKLRNRIFDPYFTTEKDGAGIGLSIVQRIINDHKGFVGVSSGKHGGAEFRIELPIEKRGRPR